MTVDDLVPMKVGDLVRKKTPPACAGLGVIINIDPPSTVITVAILDRQWLGRTYRTTKRSLELISPS